jgi:4-hydroxy-3-methylbut-2-enyl diphosphate reductase
MEVVRATELGMCFGVRDALAILDDCSEPETVTIHGELVHNEVVLQRLEERGFSSAAETDRDGLPATTRVLITAHGVSDAERSRLIAAGKELIDTTCPLVVRAHRAATTLANEGRHVVVIGKRGHVEVRGLVGDLPSFTIVQGPMDVDAYPFPRLGVVCQTTTPDRLASATLDAIKAKNPHAEVRFIDTVCHPTRNRQRAVEELLDQVDAVVVVGGKNSNNTRELAARCREQGARVLQVSSASEIDQDWFTGVERVGLTAGTSTLPETIDEVEAALRELAAVGCV